jgi:hypothetical protein
MHETKEITLFSAISSLPESIDNCKKYVDNSYGIFNQVCNWNFLLLLVIDADRRIILSKCKVLVFHA